MPLDNLIRGEDLLARYPDFRLVGRDGELRKISGMLMRQKAHNVLLVGPGGVGCTAICMGLQASKDEPDVPFDIVSKRFFWLDSDGLFSSGNHSEINERFAKLNRTLKRSKSSVLIVEDTRGFLDAARNNGCTHFINAIMRDVGNGRYQAILETRDEDLEVVLKCHSNIREFFTMMDVREPDEDALSVIVSVASASLQSHHRITISEPAREKAIDLTSKYRVSDMSLSRAQPDRTLNLLDRALTSFRQTAHSHPPHIAALEASLAEAQQNQDAAAAGLLARQVEDARADWDKTSADLKRLYSDQRDGEEEIRRLEEELEGVRSRAEANREADTGEGEAVGSPEPKRFTGFSARLGNSGFGTREENRLLEEIRQAEAVVARNKQAFDELTARINADLELGPSWVMAEFSRISGVPVDKLNQDERQKLLALEDSLKARVFGQDEAVAKLTGAVHMAYAGLKDPDKPQGSFLFCGPSGVGKTEIAKALASALKDDEKAMLRFDMSEYMEKHATAKLIGAPPGYEGYEAGGILTNSVRRHPHSIILFDEVEKAHPDVFNIFLQVLDDGRLTDNRGLTVSFADTLIIMTTNIGQPHFLRHELSFDEAMALTMADLDSHFRPEFLNRFSGRENIVGFNMLSLAIVEKIALRQLQKVNDKIAAAGSQIVMSDAVITAICKDKYDPSRGARGVPGFFEASIYPAVARAILENPEDGARMAVTYDPGSGTVTVAPLSAPPADPMPQSTSEMATPG